MEFSSREALQLGHNYIGTEHLLFAIVRDGNEDAVQVLVSLDADPGMVRQVVQMLAGYQGSTVGRLMRTSHSRIPNPHFVRSIPGPDEYDLYGGRLRIRAVEVYDKMVSIGWRAAPMPDVAAVFVYHTMVRMRQRALPLSPTDPAVQHAHDVERNGGSPTEGTRGKLKRYLALMLQSHIGLADDVGTVYQGMGGGSQDGSKWATGRADFAGALRPTRQGSRLPGWT